MYALDVPVASVYVLLCHKVVLNESTDSDRLVRIYPVM